MAWNRGVFPFGIRRLFTATTVLAGTCCLLAGAPAEAANPQEGKAFGMGKPGMIDELPAGRLRDKLNSLPPHAQARALIHRLPQYPLITFLSKPVLIPANLMYSNRSF